MKSLYTEGAWQLAPVISQGIRKAERVKRMRKIARKLARNKIVARVRAKRKASDVDSFQ